MRLLIVEDEVRLASTLADLLHRQGYTADTKSIAIAISTQCEDVEAAMKWSDYIYGEEGNLLHTFGVEGDTYTVEEIDGETHYVYTEKITKPETIGLKSVNEALFKFFRPANSPGLDQNPDYLNLRFLAASDFFLRFTLGFS